LITQEATHLKNEKINAEVVAGFEEMNRRILTDSYLPNSSSPTLNRPFSAQQQAMPGEKFYHTSNQQESKFSAE